MVRESVVEMRRASGNCAVPGRRAGLISAHVFLLTAWSVLAQEPPRPEAAAPAADPAPKTATVKEGEGSKPWYSPMKDIPLGPGTLSFDANIRSRYESLGNFNVKGYGTDERDDLLLLRTQLGMDYRLKPSVADAHFYVRVQDSRFWSDQLDRGEFPESCAHFDQFDLREAYCEAKHLGGTPLGFKLGRQNIFYADKRMLGPADWGNVGGYWWDAAKLYVDTRPVQVDLLYAKRIISEQTKPNTEHYPYCVAAVYAQIKRLPFKLDAFYIMYYDGSGEAKGENRPGNEMRHTLGFYADGATGGWDYRGTIAGQFGERAGDTIEALGVHLRGGYTFDAPWKPRLGVDLAYATGDSDPKDGEAQTFMGGFAGVSMIHGWMCMVDWKNLAEVQPAFSVRPVKELELLGEYHFFRLASSKDAWYWGNAKPFTRDKTGKSGRDLGQELLLAAKWKPLKWLDVLAAYAHFVPGEFVRRKAPHHAAADWFFTQLTVNF